ncbi:MAG: S9 family peptidase [Thermoanaerobaculia bacterium]
MNKRSLATRLAVVAILFVLPLTAWAQAQWTPQLAANLRSAGNVAISPDGSQIAYVLSVPRDPFGEENGGAWGELHVIGKDGTSRSFISGAVNVAGITWTPDGRSISFLTKRGKDEFRSLYVIDADGGEARRVLAHTADIGSYSWSPDGKQVAFLANEVEAKEKRDLEKKGFSARIYEENVRPDRIYVATLGTDKVESKVLDVPGSATELRWSPAGAQIAVAIAPTSLIDQNYTSRRVHVIDVATGKVLAKASNPGKLGSTAWSTDGKYLAIISAADKNDPSAGRLVVMSAATGELRDVLPKYDGQVGSVAWRDGDTMIYVADEGVWSTLGEVNADGSGRKTIIAAGQQPLLSGLSVAKNASAIAFTGESDRHPNEVFVWREKQPLKRLTTSNPQLAQLPFAPQEVVTWSARDGLKIEGILVRPLNEQKGTRYPLLVTVHGGPEAHDRNGWTTGYSNPGQLAASRGFAVLYPNYRGSTGRGVAFSKLGQKDPAGKEFDDIVDGVDHLINVGLVDKAKVGVTGGSYGGYATGWMSTYYSDRFAAGVMFVGISDLVSKWGTTDIPGEEFDVHALQHPWDNWQFHLERSPIFYAERQKTPLLIMGGADDPRVHPSQSMEMYRHLKARGKAPVRLVFYPGEGHGNRRAASRLDYNLRMMQWFEHYLKGPGGNPPSSDLEYTR